MKNALRPVSRYRSNGLRGVLLGRVYDVGRTALFRQRQTLLVQVDCDDGVGTGDPAKGGDELADHALPENGNGLVNLYLGAPDSVKGHSAQHCEGSLVVGYVMLDGLRRIVPVPPERSARGRAYQAM